MKKIKKLSNIPVVCVCIPLENLKTIENSNEQLVREVCRHIIDVHGCKDICLLTGQKDNHEAEERLDIMLDEIHKHGLTVKDEHIIYGDFRYTSGVNLAHDVFEGRVSKPDALIAASDHMALGFIEEYTKLGGRVPEDIRVIGFDATLEGMLDDITLTSIESNFAKCAADAVNHIRSIIEPDKEIIPFENDLSPMRIISRQCIFPIRRSAMPYCKESFRIMTSSTLFTVTG